jgi:DNA-binding response OmpR family regulator
MNFDVISLADVPREALEELSDKDRRIVLIVDDEHVIADTLSIILKKSGYTVLTAYSGLAGLELARLVPPELLITDVMMPGMTGIELAMALVKDIPTCRVLLFSGQAATRDLLLKARGYGHDFEIMAKPVHPTDMLRRVSDYLPVAS